MTPSGFTATPTATPPDEVVRWVRHSGVELDDGRARLVAGTVDHIRSVMSTLHELDLEQETPATISWGSPAGGDDRAR